MDVFLLAWLLIPLLLTVVSLGCGLLVAEAAARTGSPRAEAFPGLLVLPVGFAAVVVIASLTTTFAATAPLTWLVVIVAALAGLAAGRDRLRGWWDQRRGAVWPFAAAFIPGAAVAAPVVLTGKAGMSGYTKITDLAHQIQFIEYLRTEGRADVGTRLSSFDESVDKLIVSGYPGGAQSVVAAMGSMTGVDVAWAYQPVLAFIAAMLGLTLYALLRRTIPLAPWRAVAAGVAAQPTILYAYTLAGGIKEVSGAAGIALFAAVLAGRRPNGWSVVVPAAVAIAAVYSVFSLTVLPWIGVVFAVFALTELVRERARVRTTLRWAAVWGLMAIIALPAVLNGFTLLESAGGQSGPEGLGNLAAPVPAWSAVGPWITPDHRFPLATYGAPTPTYVLIGVALALALAGFVAAVRARDRGLVALGIAGAVAMAYILRAAGTWVELKAFCMTAPIVLALAFAGAAWLVRIVPRRVAPLRLAGLAAGGAVALGVLYGNALQYRHTTLLPYDRMTDLARIDERFAGQGPALFPDFDEFAEYFLRESQASGLVDPWRSIMTYNRLARPGLQFARDTDEYDIGFLQEFRLIIRRRDPIDSRPPGNWSLAEVTGDYEVWKRTGDPREILAHFPLDGRKPQRSARYCRAIARSAASAGPGGRVRYAVPVEGLVKWTASDSSVVTRFWGRAGEDVRLGTPGRLTDRFTVPRDGTYRMFVRGSVGRRVTFLVDDRPVGSLRWRESWQGQYELLTTLRLTAGTHRIEFVRGSGSLLPGTGNDASGATTTVGPIVFAPAGRQAQMRTIPAAQAGAACRSDTPMDWIEVLRGSGPPKRTA
ncbi:MAG: hypothetical protein QOD55_537 [Solirubrobacteraceae bacterium]|nr:hypothetical protein [Solirubrobacteraceae bacterium]